MAQLKFKNSFGASSPNGIDQQRSDLFAVSLKFPTALNVGGGVSSAGLWESDVAFAVSAFPFPDRTREMLPVKYLNQTNFQIGADTPMTPINMSVRYVFNRRMGDLLERWNWLCSNPRTGGVALTSAVKTSGNFFWLQPNMARQVNIDDPSDTDVMLNGGAYYLEGCLVQNLKPSDANMEQTGLVSLTFGLQIDRYYPMKTTDLSQTALSGIFNNL